MSEEKMYAIKNDEGEWADTKYTFGSGAWVTPYKNRCEEEAKHYGGHVVALIEEPEKVVLSDKQAKIVENARDMEYPANYITQRTFSSDDEILLMNAYVNGYTVEKEKKYVLPIPGTDYHNNQIHGNAKYYAVKGTGNWRPDAIALGTDDAVKHGYTVTKSDIDSAPDWVKTITPVEVTDDDD